MCSKRKNTIGRYSPVVLAFGVFANRSPSGWYITNRKNGLRRAFNLPRGRCTGGHQRRPSGPQPRRPGDGWPEDRGGGQRPASGRGRRLRWTPRWLALSDAGPAQMRGQGSRWNRLPGVSSARTLNCSRVGFSTSTLAFLRRLARVRERGPRGRRSNRSAPLGPSSLDAPGSARSPARRLFSSCASPREVTGQLFL